MCEGSLFLEVLIAQAASYGMFLFLFGNFLTVPVEKNVQLTYCALTLEWYLTIQYYGVHVL